MLFRKIVISSGSENEHSDYAGELLFLLVHGSAWNEFVHAILQPLQPHCRKASTFFIYFIFIYYIFTNNFVLDGVSQADAPNKIEATYSRIRK